MKTKEHKIAEVATMMQTGIENLEFVLSDASGIVEAALSQALSFCAAKMGLDSNQSAVNRLQQGNRRAYSYFHYSLAEQAAEWLGNWDENIKAVYLFDYDATSEDLCFDETKYPPLLHLIIWTQRKTGALNSIVEALDRALLRDWADLIRARKPMHFLDVHIVDDNEVQASIGYGALLSSLHTRPIRIWER